MLDDTEAWFDRDGEVFHPRALARSLWSETQLHGVALSGLLARALEQALPDPTLIPARYHVDLFKAARMVPTTTTASVVRQGSRLVLLDAEVIQGDVRVARASATFLRSGEDPTGIVWANPDHATPPPTELVPVTYQHHVPFFASDRPWSQNFIEHQNSGRHQTWQTAMPIVLGEPMTPFQSVASIADATSMVVNWGSDGVEYINSDISLALARRPENMQVGLRTVEHIVAAGIAVGVAEVFDRAGTLGVATVTALANTRRTVDFSHSEWDGSRTA